MKIGFTKHGITLNSREIDPLNINVNGVGIESSQVPIRVDPYEVIEHLSEAAEREDKLERLEVLRSMFEEYI